MKENYSILEKCSLFSGIEIQDYEPLLTCLGAQIRKFEKDEAVFSEGDAAKNIGIVLDGEVQIIKHDFYGRRSIVTSIQAGELFGESFACAGINSIPVSVIAIKKTTVLLIDCRKITRSCSNACGFHNQMILNLLHVVAEKNLRFNQKIELLSKRSTREKLMSYLLEQAKRNHSDCFSIPFDRQELADFLCVERSALSAEISKLRAEGIIESNKSNFRLLSRK